MCMLERVNQGFLYLKLGVALARRFTISNVDRRDPPILPAMKRREASHACTRLPVQLMPADVTQGGSEGPDSIPHGVHVIRRARRAVLLRSEGRRFELRYFDQSRSRPSKNRGTFGDP